MGSGLGPIPGDRRVLIDIWVRHPQMGVEQRTAVQGVVTRLRLMETAVENAVGEVSSRVVERFNSQLSDAQTTLGEIESQLQHSS